MISGSAKEFTNLAAVEIPANPPPTITIFAFASLAFAIVAASDSLPPNKNAAPPKPATLKASLLDNPDFFISASNISKALSSSFFSF